VLLCEASEKLQLRESFFREREIKCRVYITEYEPMERTQIITRNPINRNYQKHVLDQDVISIRMKYSN